MSESRSAKRSRLIEYIYQFELMGKPFSHLEAFESGEFNEKELKMLETIEKNYAKYEKLASSFLNASWSWARLAPLERAILIWGCFELSFAEKKVVINELVLYAKNFVQEGNYKFINGVLDKIGAFYEQIKTHQKTTPKPETVDKLQEKI